MNDKIIAKVQKLLARGDEARNDNPHERMLEMARRVRAGDLSARTGIQPTDEEFSQLGGALDAMAEQLQRHERDLQQTLKNLREQAMTDPLTGLYNRRFLWDALNREIAAGKRKRLVFCIILLDLDRFKYVNDTWGHEAGDMVLKAVAKLLKESVRGSDFAVRHGGEEFAILLPETSLEVAAQLAERLRQQIEEHEIGYGAERLHVTASFGVAECGPHTNDPTVMMAVADAAMYSAKKLGRNRVVVRDSSVVVDPARAACVAVTRSRVSHI